MTRGKWIALAAVLVVIAAAGGWFIRDWRYQSKQCDLIEADVAELGTKALTEGDRAISVLGDSYSLGFLLEQPRAEAWPAVMGEQLDAAVTVNAYSGSGFAQSSYCDGTAYADRVAALPVADLTIVQGGLNDIAGVDDLEQTATDVLEQIPGDVVLVGPVPAPQVEDQAVLARVDEALAAAAEDVGAEYVSALGWDDMDYAADRLHLTAEGHAEFGRRVAEALSS